MYFCRISISQIYLICIEIQVPLATFTNWPLPHFFGDPISGRGSWVHWCTLQPGPTISQTYQTRLDTQMISDWYSKNLKAPWRIGYWMVWNSITPKESVRLRQHCMMTLRKRLASSDQPRIIWAKFKIPRRFLLVGEEQHYSSIRLSWSPIFWVVESPN